MASQPQRGLRLCVTANTPSELVGMWVCPEAVWCLARIPCRLIADQELREGDTGPTPVMTLGSGASDYVGALDCVEGTGHPLARRDSCGSPVLMWGGVREMGCELVKQRKGR